MTTTTGKNPKLKPHIATNRAGHTSAAQHRAFMVLSAESAAVERRRQRQARIHSSECVLNHLVLLGPECMQEA